MEYIYNIFDWLYAGAALLALVLAIVLLYRRVKPGGLAFSIVLLSIVAWLLFRVLEGMGDSIQTKMFWAKFEYIGISILPISYFIFSSRYSRKDAWINRKSILLLCIIPLVTLTLVFTNERHGLIWSDIYPTSAVEADILVYEHGLYFWLQAAYSYSLLFLGVLRLVLTFINFPKEHQFQAIILIFATIIPWLGNVLYLLGVSPVEGMDLTPLGLAISGLILGISLYHRQIYSVVPVARNIVFDNLQEGLIVVDMNGIILDLNKAAREILRLNKDCVLRCPLERSLAAYPALVEKLSQVDQGKFEIKLQDERNTYLQVRISKIITNVNPSGRLISLQDITIRKEMELYELRQRKFAEALAHIAATLNSSLDLEVILEKMLEIIHEVVPHDAANVALLHSDKRIEFVKMKGYEGFASSEAISALDYYLEDIPNFMMMYDEKRAIVINDTRTDPTWVPNTEVGWIRSYLGSPIALGNEIIGFINVDSSKPNYYNEEHAQRLKVFADEAAIAIQNARYVEELQERNQDLRTLYEVGLAMTEGLDFTEIISGLVEQLKKIKEIHLFFFALIQGENAVSTHIYNGIDGSSRIVDLEYDLSYGFIGELLKKGGMLYYPDYAANPPDSLPAILKELPLKEMRSFLGIALMEGEDPLGLMLILSMKENAFNEKQRRLFETIISQVSVTLQNARMYDRMKELAVLDELTGVYNRRFLYLAGNREIDRASRYQKTLSMILIDIDHFKRVNDHFGHIAGDRVLQRLTHIIQEELRSSDILTRYGGEEFIILLPSTSGKAAINVAKRIREAVENMRVQYNEDEITITVSLGVTEYTAQRNSLQAIISDADQALYKAKQNGRNQVASIL